MARHESPSGLDSLDCVAESPKLAAGHPGQCRSCGQPVFIAGHVDLELCKRLGLAEERRRSKLGDNGCRRSRRRPEQGEDKRDSQETEDQQDLFGHARATCRVSPRTSLWRESSRMLACQTVALQSQRALDWS